MSRTIAIREQAGKPQPIAPQANVVAKLAERFGTLAPIVARRNSYTVQNALRDWFPLRLGDEERARRRLERLPERDMLQEQLDALRAAVWTPASDAEARLIVATMLDAIPAAKSGATVTYIDSLVDALANADGEYDEHGFKHYQGWRGFSCWVLFDTARRVIATATFTPSVAEVLTKARAIRLDYWRAFHATDKLLGFRLDAEDIIAMAEAGDDGGDYDPDCIPF